jgi:hypothetical protein
MRVTPLPRSGVWAVAKPEAGATYSTWTVMPAGLSGGFVVLSRAAASFRGVN